jgi:drug/metabolite transporter (DMT)-like permease
MLGGLLALISATFFSLNNAQARRGVVSGTVWQAMAISVPFGVPFFFFALLIFGSLSELGTFTWSNMVWLACAGIVHFVIGRYANYRGAKAMGANLVGPIQDVNILVSLGCAVFLLGEKINGLMLVGIILVCFGPVLTWKRGKPKTVAPTTFKPKWGEGILFAVISALAYGTSPIFVRLGLSGGSVGRGVAAGLISYIAASFAVLLVLLKPGAVTDVRKTDRGNFMWFLGASFTVGMAQLLRYMALALVPVSVVAPMMRLSSVFRVYFSWLINREHEIFGPGVWLGTIVSVIGALILSVQSDAILAYLPASETLKAMMAWRWP